MAHREFKSRLYPQFARVAEALASERRLELIDLLAQSPRHVEALATATDMPVANVSQHLKVLRGANLVTTSRDGTRVIYSLAGPAVVRLFLAVREAAEAHVPEVGILAREYGLTAEDGPPPSAEAVVRSAVPGDIFLIDVRPRHEYDHGHLPGAHPFPPEELPGRLDELPRDRPIVAYCRGNYCLFADEAVALLREHGFDAHRLDGGWLEWDAARPLTPA